MSFKYLLSRALAPLARTIEDRGPKWTQFWSFTRLAAALGGGVDVSVVLLGPVELRGTRRISIGRSLYAYPGQFWETQEQGQLHIGDGVVLSRGRRRGGRAWP